jgi:hypothetical protein
MKSFRVTVLRDRSNPASQLVFNVRATSMHEARQRALAMYGIKGRVVAVVPA